ncbi:MAG: class I SAM-dependent methyltransferase [Parcubacteria group bacterium]|nr:class I SAM-dependent methyltransferase [Parcubacteria group bacterium]
MKCSLCFKNNSIEFLNLGKQPLANKYPTRNQFSGEDFFPLSVFFCEGGCKNVQLGTFVSRERMFEDYYYLSSVNPGLVRHFEELAGKLTSAQFVLDVGSNDGILLRPLKKLGVKAVGIDPSINVSKIANDEGLTTVTSFFNEKSAREVKEKYGAPDVIVASSIFTHLDDPHQFIDDVKKVMAPQGVFIVEVEYIGNIIRDVQFERFYLDRIFYYSLTSLRDLFASHGMIVTDVENIQPHGGSIRIYAQNTKHAAPVSERVKNFLREEEENLHVESLKEFGQKVDAYIGAFKDKLVEYKNAGRRVAGYGSPARVATICNFGNIGPELIEFIIDDSPLKQNKFSPGTHIPIFPRTHLDTHKIDVLVVFAYEYFTDIKEKTRNGKYTYLIPIPPREVS